MGIIWTALRNFLLGKKLELALVGLENSGKTTFANHLAYGEPKKTLPTFGVNVRFVKNKNLTMKIWDLGGQAAFRPEWLAYAKSCDILVFMIDASNPDALSTSRKELNILLEDQDIANMPLLVLSNKIDILPHLSEIEIIQGLNLDYLVDNPWVVIPISALYGTNFVQVIEWLLNRSQRKKSSF